MGREMDVVFGIKGGEDGEFGVGEVEEVEEVDVGEETALLGRRAILGSYT